MQFLDNVCTSSYICRFINNNQSLEYNDQNNILTAIFFIINLKLMGQERNLKEQLMGFLKHPENVLKFIISFQ